MFRIVNWEERVQVCYVLTESVFRICLARNLCVGLTTLEQRQSLTYSFNCTLMIGLSNSSEVVTPGL